MRRTLVVTFMAVLAVAAAAAPAGAITFGQPDGNLHPNVGALLADHDDTSPGLDVLCSGTLIEPEVFLTAAHCTEFLAARDIERAYVTFEPSWDEQSASTKGTIAGTYVSHPRYACCGANDTYDIAVVLLERPARATPARLPEAGLLDRLKDEGTLRTAKFTAVGYGTVRDDKTSGPHAFYFDGIRRYALQSFLSLEPAWLNLSMQPSTGDGGTCYGDSGGPHFLGGPRSDLIVSITVTGDAMCRATDKTYRLDTPSAREFLDDFVAVP